MTETLGLIIVAAITAIAAPVVGAWVGKRFGLGKLAQEAAQEKSDLIDDLRVRLELAEGDVAKATEKADKAEKAAAETERRRAACEYEIRRVSRDLRLAETELLDLYRRTGKIPPPALVTRQEEHRVEDET